ncbi:unnamed protein product [marine sediment metagenome]|uniref:Uncharacterized protein n=1 Tax=marine sediment metagenome TaxID=412755 RepID=X0VRX8_9ZZZZ
MSKRKRVNLWNAIDSLMDYPSMHDDTMDAIRYVAGYGVDALKEKYGSPVTITCPYCLEPYKEYEKYPGCCSSCHAPPADVYPYFRSMSALRNYHTSRDEILEAYSRPRYAIYEDGTRREL